jgi:prolyl-tRNA synthetase
MTNNKLPDFEKDFSDWYNEIVFQAELVDHAPVRGCMVIRPYGYAMWDRIQQILDQKIKETGHQNAAFPLLIPLSFLQKEAEHVAGFAPEVAVVTHAGGKELEEPLVVRPTSETIIHYMFARWIRSWRDLPMKVNQWCSIIRWEKRTKPFIRTTEIWWQEGHTAHETLAEAEEEVMNMLHVYVDLVENYLAIPLVAAQKPESEKFAGADKTMTIEGLMPDGKALQMGTSHLISQSFAKAFGMSFQDRQGVTAFPFLTSWGATTRLVGALIMTHGDNKGLILPPKIAPFQIVIIPIFTSDNRNDIIAAAQKLGERLKKQFRIFIDTDDTKTPGAKYYHWELRGVPLRIELGPRDLVKEQVMLVDRLGLSKEASSFDNLEKQVEEKLALIQKTLFDRAVERRAKQWHKVKHLATVKDKFEKEGGFYEIGWCGRDICEKKIKEEFLATIRCILPEKRSTICGICGEPSIYDVLVARAY